MKAELARVREEEITMEARLVSMQTSLREFKRVISECKTKVKLVDDLVTLLITAELDSDLSIDDQTMVLILEEATRALTEAMNMNVARGNDGGSDHD
ncbi:hypothetical protein V6N13_148111 [Hibiscus sabdariffa]|uniref:Uncharacterized protein n=1 Tax=Hibiscus sabdariffa TaxID=183260 RepID=A0ABR2TXP0_9ROSI